MILNRLEFRLMNNPLRAFIQERYEVKILRSMIESRRFRHVLEIGCRNGTGTRLIKKYFHPEKITAIDLDEKMIKIATVKNNDLSVEYRVMDASELGFPDAIFDAVFDFGIIHHIPDWRKCIKELHRVLKNGGEMILEELSAETFKTPSGRLWKLLLDHPYENMFSTEEFKKQMTDEGFKILNFKDLHPLKMIKHFSLIAKKEEV
jgi:ubiquinone/menaquinone biosynthesis C-methylase UbiE